VSGCLHLKFFKEPPGSGLLKTQLWSGMSQGWRFDNSIYPPRIWPGSLAKIQTCIYKHVTSWVFDKYMTPKQGICIFIQWTHLQSKKQTTSRVVDDFWRFATIKILLATKLPKMVNQNEEFLSCFMVISLKKLMLCSIFHPT
jgi:hypothetical protein